jgi:hypothetical protein
MMIVAVCLLLGVAPVLGQDAGQGNNSSGSPGVAGSNTDERNPRDYGGTGSAAAGMDSPITNDEASTPRAPSASSDRARGHPDTPTPNPLDDAGQSHEINNTIDGRPGP